MPRNNMVFTIELLETNKEIEKKILDSIAEDFNNLIMPKLNLIRDRVATATVEFLKMSDTYDSLINGLLAGHFGLPVWGRQMMVNNILKKIGKSIEIEYVPVRARMGNFVGGANISVLVKDFSDILTMMEAEVVTEKGQWLPWLEWLLLRGDRIIISQYDVKLGAGTGRSQKALMIKGSARSWRVPTAYSGVMEDNWLTRFFEIYHKAYLDLIEEILQEELGL